MGADRAFQPRKQPVQARSTVTVDAILEATVRVLAGSKNADFTTKQVAEVAGVSVGSLYQYFPNKQALVSELIRRKLVRLVEVAGVACDNAPEDLRDSLEYVLAAIIAEKQRTIGLSETLKMQSSTMDFQDLVKVHTSDIQEIIAGLITTRIKRPLTTAENSRLTIAIDAIEGAMSRLVKSEPAKLQEAGMRETFTRLFLATLDLPEAASI